MYHWHHSGLQFFCMYTQMTYRNYIRYIHLFPLHDHKRSQDVIYRPLVVTIDYKLKQLPDTQIFAGILIFQQEVT